jgi:DNA-binding transcriptional ArsR family regulator
VKSPLPKAGGFFVDFSICSVHNNSNIHVFAYIDIKEIEEMPFRVAVAKELADLCKVIAHPDRILILEELHTGPQDVNSLAEALNLPNARISQHLALLRAHRYVVEERAGRHHIYSLTQHKLARWILDGLELLETRSSAISPDDINRARRIWSAPKDSEKQTD